MDQSISLQQVNIRPAHMFNVHLNVFYFYLFRKHAQGLSQRPLLRTTKSLESLNHKKVLFGRNKCPMEVSYSLNRPNQVTLTALPNTCIQTRHRPAHGTPGSMPYKPITSSQQDLSPSNHPPCLVCLTVIFVCV